MQSKSQWRCFVLAAVGILLLTVNMCWAQSDSTPKKRVRSPASVKGFVGGESQDHYVIRARKGHIMTVRISWRREGDNEASFDVSAASESDDAGQVISGSESDKGKSWTGKIPKTGDYVISVVAHPSAHYTLRVTVR
jgi:hypothetical protein